MSEGPLPGHGLIEPESIPGRQIDVGEIQDAAQLLDTNAHAIRVQGALVESEWDGLAGVYDAPEAPDLFLLMKAERGVGTRSDALATNYSKAASALTTLAYAISSTVKDLKDLHDEAVEFRATIVGGKVTKNVFEHTVGAQVSNEQDVAWSDDTPTRERNTELIGQVNAAVVKLDEAQAEAVNAINALDTTTAGIFAAPYAPANLDDLNTGNSPLSFGEARTPNSCSIENIDANIAQWVIDSANGVTSVVAGLDITTGEWSTEIADTARSALGMTAAGLVLFSNPAGWALQSSLSAMKADGVELPAPLKAVDDFVNGAGDHAAAAVEGFTQGDTWKTDPGKAAVNVVLNVLSVATPVGGAGAAVKAVSSAVKVGALVEKLEAIGTKIGGPTGEAFTAGVKASAAGSAEAMKAVQTILAAPDILAREAAAAARKGLAEIAVRMPTFTPSIAGIDNGHVDHMNNESADSRTSSSGHAGSGGGGGSGAGHGASSTGYDPNNYNPDGTVKDPAYGEITPERRTELLRQRAEDEVTVLDTHPTHAPSHLPYDGKAGDGADPDAANTGSDSSAGEYLSGPSDADAHHHGGGDGDGTTPNEDGNSAPFTHPSSRVTEANGIIYLDGQPKMTVIEFQDILDSSVHNPSATEIMLGKFDGGAPDNYINKAKEGGYSYFDLGPKWNALKTHLGLTNDDMFDMFNVPFLEDAIAARKTVHFSHSPVGDSDSLGDELEYLESKLYEYDEGSMSASPQPKE